MTFDCYKSFIFLYRCFGEFLCIKGASTPTSSDNNGKSQIDIVAGGI